MVNAFLPYRSWAARQRSDACQQRGSRIELDQPQLLAVDGDGIAVLSICA